jgi:hypothetical protein
MFYTDDFMADVMGIDKIPERLHHYTSIETLGLILSTHKLRFSRLDTVNDPEEASAVDLPDAATLVFASCWTAQDRESLALWRMYTPSMQGVRITLPNNPFMGRRSPTIYDKGGAMQIIDSEIVVNRKAGDWGIRTRAVNGPNKIYYTDEAKFRNVQCLIDEGDRWYVQLHDLGMTKNTYWAFEEEWRYRVLATFSEAVLEEPRLSSHPMLDLVNFPVLESALFVPLDPNCLADLDVLLGPCVTPGQEVLVSALISKFAPMARIQKSAINVRWRT